MPLTLKFLDLCERHGVMGEIGKLKHADHRKRRYTTEVFVIAIILLEPEVGSYYMGSWTRWTEAEAMQWRYKLNPKDAFTCSVSDVALLETPQMLLTKKRSRNAGTIPIVVRCAPRTL